MDQSETRMTLTFVDRTPDQVNEIVTKLRSRCAEMGGFHSLSTVTTRVTPEPEIPGTPIKHQGESEIDFSQRLAQVRAQQAQKRKTAADSALADDPMVKFARVFGADH